MTSLTLRVKDFLHDRAGATAIEYGLIASLITVALVLSVGRFTQVTGERYEQAAERIQEAVPTP